MTYLLPKRFKEKGGHILDGVSGFWGRLALDKIPTRAGILVSILIFLCVYAVFCKFPLGVGFMFQHGDSLQYLRDAVSIQADVYGHGGDRDQWVRSEMVKYSSNTYWIERNQTDVLFGDRALFSLYNATLLQLFGTINAVSLGNFFLLGFAATLVASIIGSRMGWGISWIFMTMAAFQTAKVDVRLVMTEPVLCVSLCLSAFLWMKALEGKIGYFVGFLVMLTLLPVIKNTLVYPVLLMVLASLVMPGVGRFDGLYGNRLSLRLAKWSTGGLVLIAVLLIALPVKWGVHGFVGVNPHALGGSNAAYGLWMGSLPTEWTGAYSGRVSVKTFWNAESVEFVEQRECLSGGVVMNIYWFSLGESWRFIVSNYQYDLADSIKRLTYRFFYIWNACGMWSVGGFVWVLGMIASIFAILGAKYRSFLPLWTLAFGVGAMHAISRCRDRDQEQLYVIVPAIVIVGIVWLILSAARILGGRKMYGRGNSDDHEVSLGRWRTFGFGFFMLLPMASGISLPSIHDQGEVELISAVSVGSGERSAVTALRVSQPFVFALVKDRKTSAIRFLQADDQGLIALDFEDATSSKGYVITLWSLTGIQSQRKLKKKRLMKMSTDAASDRDGGIGLR